MTNCIFYSLFFVLFLNLSLGSLRYSQVNRSFMSIYKGMLEASVITINSEGEPIIPYFKQERIEKYVTEYLQSNIEKYVKKYEITTLFVDKNTDDICVNYCREVKIALNADINNFFSYEKEQTFVVLTRDEI